MMEIEPESTPAVGLKVAVAVGVTVAVGVLVAVDVGMSGAVDSDPVQATLRTIRSARIKYQCIGTTFP